VTPRLGALPLGLALAAVVCGQAPLAVAATYAVDDGASLPWRATTIMKWRTPGPNRLNGNIVDGVTVVTLVLNTAPWLHRFGRIYMFLPEPASGPVTANWTTQGRLLPGSLVAGQRTLIYAGQITTSSISDTVTMNVHADGRRLTSDQNLDFQFEIEVQ